MSKPLPIVAAILLSLSPLLAQEVSKPEPSASATAASVTAPTVAKEDKSQIQLLATKLQLLQAQAKNLETEYTKAIKEMGENYAKMAADLKALEDKAYKGVDKDKWVLNYDTAAFDAKPSQPPATTSVTK